MKRSRITRGIVIVAMLVLCSIPLIWWIGFSGKKDRGKGEVREMTHELLADPAGFASNRFKGGIGVMLSLQSTSGLPIIHGIVEGSPAGEAGLKTGDVILEINGVATKGQPLSQIVEKIRGFTIARVDVVVLRDGTNLQCAVSRTSWKELKDLGKIK